MQLICAGTLAQESWQGKALHQHAANSCDLLRAQGSSLPCDKALLSWSHALPFLLNSLKYTLQCAGGSTRTSQAVRQ